jgi:hypothetical protein
MDNLTPKLHRLDMLKQQMNFYEAAIQPLAKEYAELKEEVREAMIEADLHMAATDYTTYSLRRTEFPMIENDTEFFAYVAETHGWDLVQKRCNSAAAKERWEHGEEIPGVSVGTRIDLGVRTR